MKICFISYWSCPLARLGVLRGGGANVYALNFANMLGELGHRVDIYTPIHRENDSADLKTHPNVRVTHLFHATDDGYKDAIIFAEHILKFIRKNSFSYDIIHAHYYYSGFVGIELKRRLSIPLVVTFHTLGVIKKKYSGITDEKRIEAERKIIQVCDRIIASSELEKKSLISEYGGSKNNIDIIYPGVDHKIFKPYGKVLSRNRLRLPKTKKIILFVGRIDPIKGISLLVDATSKIVSDHPEFEKNFRLLLIGGDIQNRKFWNNPEVQKIRYLIGVNNLSCCVKFLGSRPHDILPYYYSASDVVVLPSFYESFGLVVLEAMASKSAVVASKVGGLQFLIKNRVNGRLFKSNNRRDLANVLWETLLDDKARRKYSQGGYKYSQEFCWIIQAKKLINIYKTLV